ncbi:MAG: hypothetical protein ACRDJH_24920 [Thermomicrobiales bacterium]
MAKWEDRTFRLPDNHGWRAKAGNRIFVADRGAIRFDFPANWIFEPGTSSAKFFDRQPPDDQCTLEVSHWLFPPGIDWTDLPLDKLLVDAMGEPDTEEIGRGEIKRRKRGDLEYVWIETRFIDKREAREACARTCVARGSNVATLISFYFWPEDYTRLDPIWREVLRSLQLGQYIEDPLRHRLH